MTTKPPETTAPDCGSKKLSDASSCPQSRFDNWTREDYKHEQKRISRQLKHLEDVIPKLERERNEAEKRAEKYESALRDILRYASQDSCEFHRLETIEDLAACF